ncbi:PAS domain-containing sensor histidine kinase, partial [Myxococcota bacterium]|nr:PAS domain-containing sensor histidine kinase [Myxococcota bacterium]
RSDSIRLLGHVLCAELTLLVAGTLVASAGQATGTLPVLALVPMIALLTLGGRAVLVWGSASMAAVALGFAFAAIDGKPLVTDFQSLSTAQRYPVALLCLATAMGVGILFERLWRRSARDFAARARADVALREDRYRTLLEHASEGILVLDATSRVRFASVAAERLVGFEPGRLVGRVLVELVDETSRIEAAPLWHRALAHPGERFRAELGASFIHGGERPGELLPNLEFTITNCLEHPAIRGIVIHVHDVTDLARAKANYQNLVEESIQGIAVFCDRRVVYGNQALARLFGGPVEGLIGLTFEQALARIHPDDAAVLSRMLRRESAVRSNSVELRIRPAEGGEWGWFQVRWADAIWEGRRARQIAFADVTAQKELDARRQREQERLETRIAERTRELEESQRTLRAQERLAAVGTLAAGVAHQINNPVGAILAAADFAVASTGDEDGEQVAHSALKEIRAQAVRCGKIVRSILQFSRAESTKKWNGDLVGVLRTAVDVTRRFAKDRGANVVVEIEREVGESSVLMSPIELEQVFVNLIQNAIQAQPFGAEVQVSARRSGHEIRIRVEDDGPGVPEADRDRIFDPFFTTRLKGGGTGLGLSVAHGIVADHGGHMALAPAARHPDRLACFEVVLPIEKPEAGIPVGAT